MLWQFLPPLLTHIISCSLLWQNFSVQGTCKAPGLEEVSQRQSPYHKVLQVTMTTHCSDETQSTTTTTIATLRAPVATLQPLDNKPAKKERVRFTFSFGTNKTVKPKELHKNCLTS